MHSFNLRWTSFAAFFLFTIIVDASVAADPSCSTVRMDKDGGSVSSLKVQNQGSTFLCYSYTAMEILDSYRASILKAPTNEHGSITHAAALSKKLRSQEEIESYAKTLAKELEDNKDNPKYQSMAKKYYEENVSSATKRLTDPDDDGAGEAMLGSGLTEQTLQVVKDNKFVCSSDLFKGDSDSESSAESLLAPVLQIRRAALKSTNPSNFIPELKCELENTFGGNLNDLDKIASHIINDLKNKDEYIISVVENSCSKKIDTTQIPDPQNLQLSPRSGEREKQFTDSVNGLMDSAISENLPPQPIGISFQHNVLFKGGTMAGGHAAIIVGREMVNGVCSFIVRNSFGAICDDISGSKYKYPCKDGQIWVPATVLGRSVNSLTWLPVGKEPPKK